MKDLTTGKEWKVIFRFALPMVLGNLFQQLYHVVDSIIVGRFVGKEALAAVGASFPIFYTLIAFVIGIGSGATIVISQYFGAKDYDKVRKAIGTIYIFLFFVSFVLTGVGIFFSYEIFSILGVGSDVLPGAVNYFQIYMLGMVAFFGFNGTSSVLRGLGDSKTPLKFLTLSTVLNIILDLLFIVVFKWGITGAAVATVLAHGSAFVAAIIYINRRKNHLIQFKVSAFVFDFSIFKQSLKIGLPTGFQQTFVALGMMALLRIVNNFDTSVLAAYIAAGRIDSFAAMPALNLSSALSAFVGQNLGANKIDRIKKGLRATWFISFVFSLFIMLVVYVAGEFLIKLFVDADEVEVIKHGARYLVIVSSFYFVFSSMFVLHGVLRGAGATLVPMFITLFSLWVIRIPSAIFLSEKMGVDGIWWAIPSGWCVGLLGSLFYYLSGRWKGKGVVR